VSEATTEGLGPIDYLVVEFPGNQFNGGVLPALTDLIARGLVRVLDLALVSKADDGTVTMGEIEDLGDEIGRLSELADFLTDLVTEEDLEAAAEVLEPNSTAAIIVWENTWAVPFVAAVAGSGGEVIASGRLVAADVLNALTSTT